MKTTKINIVLCLGVLAITGILVVQLFLMKEAFSNEEQKFNQKVNVALLEVVKQLYGGEVEKIPQQSLINKISDDYYLINVNRAFEMQVLEFYLVNEFKKINITTDFEYAIYQCETEKMLYGNYISYSNKPLKAGKSYFPKYNNLVYYFAVRFPDKSAYFFSNLKLWILLSVILFLILIIYVYSIFIILRQKKYADLQRDFINNMTHEFKTPLSSILIASNYLIKQPQIETDEKLEKYTGIIIDQSNKLNNHIERILGLAKADAMPVLLDKTAMDALMIINNTIENIKLKYPALQIDIATDSNPFFIKADVFHFANVVYNLIDNSIKYSNQNPKIHIRLCCNNTISTIQFIDNGLGIAPKNQQYVFDKFYREKNSKSNETNGFGLGLYYVKKICLLHHWKIKLESKINIGTTISIIIKNETV